MHGISHGDWIGAASVATTNKSMQMTTSVIIETEGDEDRIVAIGDFDLPLGHFCGGSSFIE